MIIYFKKCTQQLMCRIMQCFVTEFTTRMVSTILEFRHCQLSRQRHQSTFALNLAHILLLAWNLYFCCSFAVFEVALVASFSLVYSVVTGFASFYVQSLSLSLPLLFNVF